MANITDKTAQIRQAVYGKDVRESIASGIEAINDQQNTYENNLTNRQDNYESNLTNQQNNYEEDLTSRQNIYEEGINNRQTSLEQDWVTVKQNAEDATADANTSASFATTQGNFAKAEGEALVNTINQFNYVGEYDPTKDYQPKNMVKYNGSTYVNNVTCRDVPPTDKTKWQIIATGYVIKGNYNSNSSYLENDIVYYGIEKKFYQCIQPAGLGISPYNTSCWKVLLDASNMLQEINDYVNNTTSIYVAFDMDLTITHNLNKYPLAKVIATGGAGFGEFGYGMSGFGGGQIYQVLCRAEYPDLNTIKLYLNESFNGTPTITPISSTVYDVVFSNDNGIQIELI